MSQYLDKDGATRIAENFLSKQAEQDAILANLQFDLKEAEHALVKTVQGPAPLNIRALSRPLDDYMISGNTVQNGTPTPEAPVDVVGCGVRTGNIVDFYDRTGSVFTVNIKVEKQKVTFSGTSSGNGGRLTQISSDVVLEPGVYSLSTSGSGRRPSVILQSKTDSSKYYFPGGTITLESKETFFISFLFTADQEYNGTLTVMLNTGSTALPYEPYGYKLPITIGGTEYPIYLGQVQTTRSVKKLVLTGGGTWRIDGGKAGVYSATTESLGISEPIQSYAYQLSSHFALADSYSTIYYNSGYFSIIPDNRLIISYFAKSSIVDFKSYLAAQYAAGTPVTVWYVLAEPETAVVNEPLMKIGNYADTLSMAQAGVEISTTKGFNTITTNTTVLPSNIEVKGVINNA